MRIISRTSQFKRDVKRVWRRGKDMEKLKRALVTLIEDGKLPPTYRDHVLVGQYRGTRECHLEPDWLLIYESTEREVILIRTGSHSDLFKG